MTILAELDKIPWNNQREQWENTLKRELKIDDLKGKTSKRNLDVKDFPTLSLEGISNHLTNSTPWKKAAQTYITIPANFKDVIEQDLANGVRVFFFHKKSSSTHLKMIEEVILSHPDHEDCELCWLGEGELAFSSKLKIYDEKQFLTGRFAHDYGGNAIQELATLLVQIIENIQKKSSLEVGIFVDSHFFSNVAKIRALRLLILKVQNELGLKIPVKIIALNSYREWSLYECNSNMLRNDTQVASALIGGADLIQSSGYGAVFELEAELSEEHAERARRMARNTSHILSLESMLGMVEDAAFGSYHLESLTQRFAAESWMLMQEILPLEIEERSIHITRLVNETRAQRDSQIKTRKLVIAGVNDYANPAECLSIKELKGSIYRTARCFEELRIRVENLKARPEVVIKVIGDYATLSPRLNFIRNYFELIGLKVHDPLQKSEAHSAILVLCALDADYPQLVSSVEDLKSPMKYVAGKVEFPGFISLHSGQDVHQILSEIVSRCEVGV